MQNTPTLKAFSFQSQASAALVDGLRKHRGMLLQGGTGTGKTYIVAQTIKDSLASLQESDTLGKGPFPVLWICPAATKMQTERVLSAYGISRYVMVMSYSSLTSPTTGGTMFYKAHTIVHLGKEDMAYEWNNIMLPKLVVFDECQALKNEESTRTNIARSIPEKQVKRLFISATPYQRVCEARTVMVGVGMVSEYNALPLSQNTAPSVMRSLATYGNPHAYSPKAMSNVKDVMEPYTVALKNVRFKCKARTECVLVDFANDQQRQAYQNSYNEYLQELYRLRGQTGHGIVAARLVAMLKFRQKAEEIRSPLVAARARNAVEEGSQVIIASNFKGMLRGAHLGLTNNYDVDDSRIGYITGNQSAEARQRDVDAFQRGEKDYMLLTIQAGGVGISLHHEYESARPRHIILPPTWSAIDLIQCVGRSHRLTSMSNTLQEILWYRGTIEEQVAATVENKVSCINRAVAAKEQWASLFAPNVDDDLGNVDGNADDDYDYGLDEGMLE